ncbi:MAG: PDZ domain-containing protein [Hymenobacter sp.]
MDLMAKQGDSLFVEPRQPFTLREVVPGNPAAKAGILVGDRITRIGNTPIRYYDELLRTYPPTRPDGTRGSGARRPNPDATRGHQRNR